MFLRERVERCPQCEEVTPHSRRRIALPWIAAAVTILWALLSVLLGVGGYLGPGVLAAVALSLVLCDREQLWHVRCVRCRTKKLVELRGSKPRLDGNAEILL